MTDPRVVTLPPDGGFLPDGSKAGGWWHELDEEPGRMICDLCPRACNLRPGDRGFCFVRENRDGQMVLTTYGRSTGFCIDPIEKKPLNHFYPGTSVLSFGTAGCNLGCKFCQNHDISKAREVERISEHASPETIARAAVELGCRSVAHTYNDPVIWAEYAIDTARACREVGVKSVAVTAGYISPSARGPFFENFDAANVDLKSFSEQFYYQLTAAHIQPVLETLQWLKRETNVWLEITNLIIPRENDSTDELSQLCDWILRHVEDDVPVHFTAFHPDFRMMDRPRTPHESLLIAHDLARQAGLKYVYVGNVNDVQHQSTYCPSCGHVVIERNWHQLGEYRLRGKNCANCDYAIAGHFDQAPGTWGRRRQPVQISRFAVDRSQNRGPSDSDRQAVQHAEPGLSANGSPTFLPSSEVSRPAGEVTVHSAEQATQNPKVDNFDFSPAQQAHVHHAACELIAAAVTGSATHLDDPTLAGVADRRVMGAYVSIKRRGLLRGCCGFIGSNTPLLAAIELAAKRTAIEDVRLPPVSPVELPYLEVEVWLLQGLVPIDAEGPARADEIVIGRDGLHIARGNARGLLLPGVATENQLDAESFLRHVCIKAGLPPTAWREAGTTLQRFEGRSVKANFDRSVLEDKPGELPSPLNADEFGRLADFCRQNVAHILRGAVPNYYLTGVSDGMVYGGALTIARPSREPTHVAQITLRPPIPMQTTLYSLAETAARALQSRGVRIEELAETSIELTILDDPAMQGTASQPDLRGFDPTRRALLAISGTKSAWRFDPSQTADQLVQQTIGSLGRCGVERAGLYSLRAICTSPPVQVTSVPRPQAGPRVRPPAVAGAFYPSDAGQLSDLVNSMMPDQLPIRHPWRAALIPHAGLPFSGRIAAQVLAHIDVPDTVIVIGPKHTRLGVDWSVCAA